MPDRPVPLLVLTETETQANAYPRYYAYNIDLLAGGRSHWRTCWARTTRRSPTPAITQEIARRRQIPSNIYFLQGDGGFESIADDQTFFLGRRWVRRWCFWKV